MITWEDRANGAILGLAVGDALGTTLEFRRPNSFAPITDMVGGGPFNLQPGQWTDDTSMALCLAESLTKCRGFDPIDQLKRYCLWFREGHLSSTGHCFDIGRATRNALQSYEVTGDPYSGSTDPATAGNGSLMRLAPVPIFYASSPIEAMHWAAESSRTTHGAAEAVDACSYFAGLICGALQGRAQDEILSWSFVPADIIYRRPTLAPALEEVALGSFKTKEPPEIQGSGYVVRSLEAALWAFHKSSTFEEGALLAVNLGDDADTTGAIYGQLAGAYYGISGIPRKWLDKLWGAEMIRGKCADLVSASHSRKPGT